MSFQTFGIGVLGGFLGYLAVDKFILSKKKVAKTEIPLTGEKGKKIVIPQPAKFTKNQFKVVIGIRTDLNYTLYQNASILGDVVIKAVDNAFKTCNPSLPPWYHFGQAKISTKVPDAEEMNIIIQSAKDKKVDFVTLEDNGQICAIALGPSPVEIIDPISRKLKLL